MGGGCDGEGAREIDIEDGDLRSRAKGSMDGGCHGRVWRLRVDTGSERCVVGHGEERGEESGPLDAG